MRACAFFSGVEIRKILSRGDDPSLHTNGPLYGY